MKYLFACTLIVYLSKKLFRNDWVAALVPTLLLITFTRSGVFRMLPFVWTGYFLYRYRAYITSHLRQALIASLVFFLFFLYFWKGDYDAPIRFLIMKGEWHINLPALWAVTDRMLVGIGGSTFFILLFQWIYQTFTPGKFLNACARTGQNTLGIYAIQIYLLEWALDMLHIHFTQSYALAIQVVYAVIVFLVCNYMVILLGKSRWTALFFLGKRHVPS